MKRMAFSRVLCLKEINKLKLHVTFFAFRYFPSDNVETMFLRLLDCLCWKKKKKRKKSQTFVTDENQEKHHLLGISTLRKACATRSAGCPCRWRRTTCRRTRISTTTRKIRASGADICRDWRHATPRRSSSPCRRPAIRPWDSSRERISATWSRVASAVCPRVDPTSAPCCPIRRSTVSSRRRICRCRTPRPCDLGTALPETDSEDPRQRCCRRCSSWSTPSSPARSPERSRRGRRRLIRPWSSASDSPDPRYSAGWLRHRLSAFCHPVAVSLTWTRRNV